jgi:hypothetical protein
MKSLSAVWQQWIVANLCEGHSNKIIEAGLRKAGVPSTVARRAIATVAASPGYAVAKDLTRRVQRLELMAALARHHAAQDPTPTEVERRELPTHTVFVRDYVALARPVVFTDVASKWPAIRRWSLDFFRKKFAATKIDVATGRNSDPLYDQNTAQLSRRMFMAKFIDLVEKSGVTNDLYMVANNQTMQRRAFAKLLDDVRMPRGIITDVRPQATSLWIGPAGTVTPLHHDTTNILFSQIVGRKRFELIAPTETVLLLDPMNSYYSPVNLDQRHDAKHPALRAMQVRTVDLEPGDTLFLPAGWWHRVTSLDISVSFSLLGFARGADAEWYRPGQI